MVDKIAVLAIDPGITTGMAYTDNKGELLAFFTEEEPNKVLERISKLWGTDVTVVVEDFVGAGPRTKEAIFVLKLIGGVCASCYLGNVRCVPQVPQTRIPLLYDAKRKAPKGMIIHAIDAYAHALAFLEREALRDSQLLGK